MLLFLSVIARIINTPPPPPKPKKAGSSHHKDLLIYEQTHEGEMKSQTENPTQLAMLKMQYYSIQVKG